ncbi:MAG: DUF899 domain-containing protein [Acidimicrobiales bacterium]
MSLPDVVSREEWLVKRRELLMREKEHTRLGDRINADRRRLPMVEITKEYRFAGPAGTASLLDLFKEHRQLVIQHFMFDPSWEKGCPSCTASVDETSGGLLTHLRSRSTNFALVSRAPLSMIEPYRSAHGWELDWYSSFGTDFNYDFHVTLDASVAPVQFNYRDETELATSGFEWMLDSSAQPMEQPGVSCFLRDEERVFHTYSSFGRGVEGLGGSYPVLDLTALGRQEAWEEPKGRVGQPLENEPNFEE